MSLNYPFTTSEEEIMPEEKQDAIVENLRASLKETRKEPGLSLGKIAVIIKQVFDEAEIECLKDQLK